MTTEYEGHNKGREGKTLDDIYDAIRSIDFTVSEILDEICKSDDDDYNGWSVKELYDNESRY